jgi:hypothetical protein
MLPPEQMEELKTICPDAREMSEAGLAYILLPGLRLPEGNNPTQVDALLCLQQREGYPTRLFLSEQVAGKGNNWNSFRVLDRTWLACSWNNVGSLLRPAQVLAEHLRAFR